MMFKEMFIDVLPLLHRLAPTIAGVIGSPIVSAATTFAMSLLSEKFGIDPKDIGKLPNAIVNDPECTNKLCQLESAFSEWLQNRSFNLKMPNKAEFSVKLEWDYAS